MQHRIAWAIAALFIVLATSAAAVPEQAFTEQHFKYVETKRQEFLAPIRAKGQTPTAAQDAEATCRALLWWKLANPGGEAKLTYAALVALRRAEVICGQKMRRAKPISIETGNPPATTVRAGSKSDGTQEAYEDFIRWHQVTLTNTSTIMDYVQAKLTEWGLFGPGNKLYDDVKKAEEAVKDAIRSGGTRSTQSAYHDLDMARLRLANAESEEANRAALEYARAHPVTLENAANIMEYVRAQVFVWGLSDAAKKLYDDVKKAEGAVQDAINSGGMKSTQSAYHDLDMARLRLANAEAEESNRAALEYARAHPVSVNDPSTADYVNSQVFLWGYSDEGKKLYDDLAKAKAGLEDALHNDGNWQSADMAVKVAQARVDAAEAAAREKAHDEWRAAHPGQPENWPQAAGPERVTDTGDYRIGPTDPRVWSGWGGAGSYPLPLEELPPAKQAELRAWEDRVANGSVDPLDAHPPTAANTTDAAGASVYSFSTPQGQIGIWLPSDIRAGDTISGTVVSMPTGKTEAEQAANRDTLNGYVLDVGGKTTPVKDGLMRWTVPAGLAGDVSLVLKSGDRTVGRVTIPLTVVVSPLPDAITLPQLGQTSRPVIITGPFDGDSRNTTVNIGGQSRPVLAESPRSVVVAPAPDPVGPTTIEVKDGQEHAQGNFRNLGISLTAPKTTLLKGEKTELHVEIQGLEGLTTPVPLKLEATQSVELQGGNTQILLIQPRSVNSAGRFSALLDLQAVADGEFSVTATVGPMPSVAGAPPPKKKGILDGILGHVSIGVGVGGSHSSGGQSNNPPPNGTPAPSTTTPPPQNQPPQNQPSPTH